MTALVPGGTAFLRFRSPAGAEAASADGPETSLTLRAQDLSTEIVDLARALIRLQDGLDRDEARAFLLLVLATIASVRQGSTRLCIEGPDAEIALRDRIRSLVGSDETADREIATIDRMIAHRRLGRVVGSPGEYKPLILDGPHLYLQRMQYEEDRFVAALAERIHKGGLRVDPDLLRSAIADVRARPALSGEREIALSEEQSLAVERAIERRFSVTSGGPGTGKTSIVLSVLRVLVRLGEKPESIALAAPTGKAAKRIAESVERGLRSIASPSEEDRSLLVQSPKPETLHRLLGYSPSADRFSHHGGNPLSERTVIVDESSMIDLALMAQLVRAVREDARLMLLGDAGQLPSVDAGAVLRDITAETSFSTTLRQSFRIDTRDPGGQKLQRVARLIHEGSGPLLFSDAGDGIIVRDRVRSLTFSKVEIIEPGDAPKAARVRDELLNRWHIERIQGSSEIEALRARPYRLVEGRFPEDDARAIEALLAHNERSKILCITRSAEHPTGARAVNADMHERAVRNAQISGAAISDRNDLIAGEPILIERNDYERKLFNGDQGVVVDVAEDGGAPQRMAVFSTEGALTAFHWEAMRDELTLCYAITVHKSQGSEFDTVLLILPDRDMPLVSREILYTALTRSRRSAVVFGARTLLLAGVARRLYRDSGVSEKLARALVEQTKDPSALSSR